MASSEHCSDCCDIREVLSTSVQSSSSGVSSTSSSSFVIETADIDDQQRQAAAQHMKVSLPAKFHALVTMHLSFLLDLSGTGLSELIDNKCHTSSLSSSSSSSCSSMPTSSSWVTSDSSTADSSNRAVHGVSSFASFFSRRKPSKDHQKATACFGQSLTQHSITRIYPVIEFLSRPENLRQEGLFRKAGQVDRQKALCDRLTLADTTDVFSDLSEFSVHDCASVLKSFLGDLPEPLLTEQYLTAYRQITDMQSDAKRLQALQLLIHLLPNEHSTLLHQVLNLLHRVTAEPGNRMTSENLAILFVPHIVVPRKTPMQELQQTSAAFTGLVSFMIEHVDEMYQLPDALIRDVAFYYRHLSDCAVTMPAASDDDENLHSSSANSAVKKKADDSDDDVLVTVVGFADRQASQQAAAELDTAKAIADLYDHVSNLPDSAYKRRFLKQFNKSLGTPNSATPTKRKFPMSFTQSFKKILKRRHKVGVEPDEYTLAGDTTIPVKKLDTPNRPVGDNICDTTGISLDTPVKNLFGGGNPVATSGHCRDVIKSVENVADSRPECRPQMGNIGNHVTSNSSLLSKDKTAQLSKSDVCLSKPRRSSSGVVCRPEVVSFAADVCCGNDDDDDDINSCSDKENVAASDSCANRVFLFHHTQSVVAMERIFAEQRLPNYVKPKGYISPLGYKRFATTPSHAPTVTVIAKP